MRTLVLVCLCGAAGSGARYLISLALSQHRSFPFATLAVNITGSFLIGLLIPWGVKRSVPLPTMAALTAGLLGGFTTYSAFNYEVTAYLSAGEWGKGFGYLAVTVLGALVAGFGGLALAK